LIYAFDPTRSGTALLPGFAFDLIVAVESVFAVEDLPVMSSSAHNGSKVRPKA